MRLRVVIDTNVLLRGLASESSAAARLIHLAGERRFITLLSHEVLLEYAAVLTHPVLVERLPSLTSDRAARLLSKIKYIGELIHPVRARFALPRDPKDEKFLRLAISGAATHLVTLDQDLTTLRGSKEEAGKRFRQRLRKLQVVSPAAILDELQ